MIKTMQTDVSFIQILSPYKKLIEKQIQANLNELGPKTLLRDACEYALMNGGKRFRPALVLMVAKALGYGADVSQAALGVEFFHTASLIADDLPCMDNDDFRRDQPSLHKAFGESAALLASYALIAAGYGCLAKNAQIIKSSSLPFANSSDYLCTLALENATYNTGILGATGGQFLDLAPPDLSLATLREVIRKKTVTLFEISFVLGWVFGGGDCHKIDLVKKSAEHFGMAFQIADDLGDRQQDITNGRSINLANVCGEEEAKKMFRAEIQEFEETLKLLKLKSDEFYALIEMLLHQVK
jgi:geranylgeranyl diphosphate synthase, type II